ncbi:methyltransferase, TIGR04325 family [Paraburkholderia acidisoli]|uniref:Methyltransferase, TIGR04325 family n=1 Tax=Paraburkholderia acidisoli TaxID=2571748 RepID=A0A7Z2GFY7_9BURK|nr:methyltransferase, TIGR04325 family [Paraburkholderia acidisoli]QGZ60775.1 methyltransferase, TIGR04325 family [Paraburkholderia acidisoli]
MIEGTGRTRFGATLVGWMLGYRRSFRTLGEAESAVRPFAKGGHENPANAAWHLDRAAGTSDYAAFYYLRDRLSGVRKIFDMGGNVGNLYYCYRNYLPLRDDVTWTVYDLPENISRGRTLASDRDARNLSFTDDFSNIGEVDLFIASGSLHYFSKPLPELIASIAHRPQYILINRTPLIDGSDFAVVQDVGHIRVACMLYNRAKLIDDFRRLGYGVLGEWRAPEFGIPVPDHPSANVIAYTGLWLERLQ